MKKIFLTLALFNFFIIAAQENISQDFVPDFHPVSPQAAVFGKYLDLPVDLSTGRVNHQVPLYSISEGGVTVPILLSYNYSGLMVDEKSSTTGLGWSLMAGGVITRKINGKPDEMGYLNGAGQMVYDYSQGKLSLEQESTLIVQSAQGNMDTQPDKFIVIMANGLNATFYLNHNKEVVFFPDSNLKVEYTSNLTSFTVTDTKGNKYVFSDQDSVETISTSGSNASEDAYISSWYLTEIIPYNSKRAITFEYDINTVTQFSKSKNIDFLQSYPSTYSRCNQMHKVVKNTNHISIFNDLIIKQIKTHTQVVDFFYTLTDNHRGKVISEIHSTNAPNYIFSIQPDSGEQLIQKIEKQSGAKIEPYYAFEYESGNYNPESNRKDYLGFYNPNNNGLINDDGTIQTSINFNATKTGALKKITFPTGGFSAITYEQNKVNKNSFNVPVLIEEDKCSYSFSFSKTVSIPNTFPSFIENFDTEGLDIKSCGDKLTYSTATNVEGAEMICSVYNNTGLIKTIAFVNEYFPAGETVARKSGEISLPFYSVSDYEGLRYEVSFILPNSSNPYPYVNARIGIGYDLEEEDEPNINDVNYPGIRVKEIKTCEASNIDCIKKQYTYLNSKGETSGLAFSKPKFWSHSFNRSGLASLDAEKYDCNLTFLTSNSVTPVSSYSGNPVLYKDVQEILLSDTNEKLGEKHFSFTGKAFPSPILPYLEIPNFEWENGKLIKSEVYNKQGLLKQQKSMLYSRYFKVQPEIYSFKAIQTKFAKNISSLSFYKSYTTSFLKSSFLLKNDTIKTYLDTGVNTVVSNLEYNPFNLEVATQSTLNSEVKYLENKYKYPIDFPSNPIMQNLVKQNQVSIPIISETRKEGVLLNSKVLEYDEFNSQDTNPLTLLKNIQTSKDSNPLEDRIIYHDYDNKGNPLEVSKKDGTHIVYIWGYNQTQPIVKIENATYGEVELAATRIANTTYNSISKIQNLSNLDTDLASETYLKTALNDLRDSLPNAQVTTYTYDPLIGVTSVTDPRGETVYYHYDNFNRLEFVKDAQGNILSKNQYNYKN